ncbi:MAG: hypothetical protein ACRYFS_14205 [Janthinobacterium lividum]
MPYRFIPAPSPTYDPSYVNAIAQELRLMRDDGSPDAPMIIEEQMPYSDRIHVTVIWDRWAETAPEDRSRVILDAYERVRGSESILNLSAALGLTHADAKNLGVENGVLSAV